MPAPTIFDRLCDLVDELGRLEYRMDHGAVQLALTELIDRFDALIDDTVGLETPHVATPAHSLEGGNSAER